MVTAAEEVKIRIIPNGRVVPLAPAPFPCMH